MKLTTIIARAGWYMAASSPTVGPYLIATQDDRVQYVRDVTDAINSGVVYSREDGSRLDKSLADFAPVLVDWTAQC